MAAAARAATGWASGGRGEGEGGGGEGEGGGGEGGGGEGEGGGGEGGGGEGEDGQQASLHFAESFLFFFWHRLVHGFCFVPRCRPCRDLPRCPFLDCTSSSSPSAAQSFGDGAAGAGPSARRPLISGSAFAVSTATSGVVDGAAAPTQLSTLRAASRHLLSGTLIICVDHVRFRL